ncbi:MAG: hypothetical protein R3F56_06180 [Planctomycetota bacterium]
MNAPRPRPEVLALGDHRGTLATLLRAVRAAGARAFSVASVDGARTHYLVRGHLDLLVIAPDTSPPIAAEVADAIWAINPEVEVVVFGRTLLRGSSLARLHRIPDLHATSRAGLGALRRHLTTRCTPELGT